MILFSSAIQRALFSHSSQGVFVVVFYRAFLSGSVLSSIAFFSLLLLLRMHAINSCVGDK